MASAASTSGAVEASIGAIGRPTSSRNAASASSPSPSAADGDRAEIAAQHQRPPHRRDRHLRGLRHRVADDRRQRALAQVAEDQRAQEGLLGRRRARQQRASARRAARACDPAPLSAASASNAASTSATDSVGSAAAGGSSFSDAQPTPSTRWRGAPAR